MVMCRLVMSNNYVLTLVVPEAPGSLKASEVDKTSLTLSWAPPTNPNGRVLEYQVNYFGYKEEDNSVVTSSLIVIILM